jgi:hypothetical protein
VISVTNTTNKDKKNTNAGYGDTTIDLGAPGTIIASLLPNNLYGTKTGTSMAAPQVTGAVALMMSVADSAFMVQYKNKPGEFVLKIKESIISSTDSINDLIGKTVSGGRLNLFKALTTFISAPVLSYSPDSVFAGLPKDDTVNDTLIIQNIGSDTLNYTISIESQPDWLTFDPSEGSLTAGQSDDVILTFNSSGMDTGFYQTTLMIVQEGGAISEVPVEMHVYNDVGVWSSGEENTGVTVFPNPFEDAVSFEIKGKVNKEVCLEVFDRSGKKVFEKTYTAGQAKAGVSWKDSRMKSGLYFYKISLDSRKVKTGKMLKL